ncbi:RND family efflux transporter, MFP subunit [Galbibacter orientalis DSM 19592]|uniref:RND family efflux transporter, MFP subunit n=1 Tax=Galbibacter orientalis DSM 19592 TaxID=926559 RepID=I3C6S9_9FLAO|nr:efflux RND transporter periplasmic adaptor subunit [Galbibacter orientalis]EIJ39322.1 RND family efflux transporter, MFP subunit [Galbibacter orientalis DSM 19592]
MNFNIKSIFYAALVLFSLSSCKQEKTAESGHEEHNETASAENGGEHQEESAGLEGKKLHLSQQKFEAMGLKVDSLPTKSLTGLVEANGQLEVPPQNEAAVTAIIGANVTSIKVIEGDKVSKGSILGYLSHPDLIKLQTDYSNAYNRMNFLNKEYDRQKRLYDAEVASGRKFQETESEYNSMKGMVKGLESKLRLFGVSLDRIRNGNVYSQVPVVSPINGYVEKVNIKVGQFVQQQTEIFEIVNTEHIHADLMVYEKDVSKVKEGQTVEFNIESLPESDLSAKIYSVGKTFEQNPKAVHVHAEIEKKQGNLFPGMYITGKIATSENQVPALPEEAIITENGEPYIFTAKKVTEGGEEEWALSPLKVVTGQEDDGWVEIKLLQPLQSGEKVVWNKAYYLISEMKKGETEHGH